MLSEEQDQDQKNAEALRSRHYSRRLNPQLAPVLKRWITVLVIFSASLCVTCSSSIAASTEAGMASEFGVSKEVTVLGISLFVMGLGLGPLVVGPLSEVHGRNIVYCLSYAAFFAFSWPIAFAPDIAVFLVFRFVTGLCGSAFLSVAGGSVSDMFPNASVANPMAVYTLTPFLGPILGPLIGGFINQNVDWRWTYRVQIIWVFVELVLLLLLVPETYAPVLLKWKAARLRAASHDAKHTCPLDRHPIDLRRAVLASIYTPFQLMAYDRMALLLNAWNALLLGILYLAFQAFPLIFKKHGFSAEQTGMSFLGIGLGMVGAIACMPFWNRLFERETLRFKGHPPPETRLYMGQVGGILVPIGLFWLAFTTYASVPWIIRRGRVLCVHLHVHVPRHRVPPIAASAMAADSALRSMFAAAFPLFAGAMYARLGTVGTTALLAGLTAVMAPLPFIFYKIGPRLREKSRFAAKP
ncbi:MFS general substrate transporter [Athelia psychrophila]|uniref:MFS general substrate transporter n=1 Tax=Athelia psychrophila TaxID=1759441 RepID=A0A166KZC1_9AGAM|nr:MFS general substrate transporter [Fibularhizoctonia sp. CBS 109695]